tara:strand:+ start:378 stop:1007 length:630 start_codon:yes stop_codon:yes gene_type:complete
MSYRWTEGSVRDANIVDEDEFNREYNNYKGEINGGLDRDNLPVDCVGAPQLKAGAFLIYDLSSPDDLMVQGLGTSSSSPASSTFDDNLAGWVHNTAQKSSVTTQEGMLHIDFCCWFDLEQHSPGGTASAGNENRWAQMGILLNNNFVAKTNKLWTYAGNVNMSIAVPVASGPQQVHIAWRAQPPYVGRPTTTPSFAYGGGQLLLINRYR